MPDPLHEAIATAIQGQLDGTLFERCAVDLLHDKYYPNLRGTPYGHDAGIDGIAGPDAEPEFVLVATTAEDFARNLRQSINRHVGTGTPAAPLCSPRRARSQSNAAADCKRSCWRNSGSNFTQCTTEGISSGCSTTTRSGGRICWASQGRRKR